MVSDEVVTRTKLGWWHQVLFEDDPRSSTHPLVRQLVRLNLLSAENQGQYEKILLAAIEDMDKSAPVSESGLKSLCQKMGENQMLLEVGAKPGQASSLQLLEVLSAINGLVQLLRESSRRKSQQYQWVPLNVLARTGVTRSELESGTNPEKVDLILTEVCALPGQWLSHIAKPGKVSALLSEFEHEWRVQHLHFLVLTALNMRCITKLHKQGLQHRIRVLSRPGPSDALFSWRIARHLTRRAK